MGQQVPRLQPRTFSPTTTFSSETYLRPNPSERNHRRERSPSRKAKDGNGGRNPSFPQSRLCSRGQAKERERRRVPRHGRHSRIQRLLRSNELGRRRLTTSLRPNNE